MAVKFDASKALEKLRKLNKYVESTKGDDIFQKLADEAYRILYARVKSGYGVNTDKGNRVTKVKLAELKESYIKFRKLHKPTGSFSGVSKSNLTYTGFLLDNIKSKIRKGGFELFPGGTRNDGLDNKKLAEYVSEKRPFFALTDEERNTINKMYERILRDLARSLQ